MVKNVLHAIADDRRRFEEKYGTDAQRKLYVWVPGLDIYREFRDIQNSDMSTRDKLEMHGLNAVTGLVFEGAKVGMVYGVYRLVDALYF